MFNFNIDIAAEEAGISSPRWTARAKAFIMRFALPSSQGATYTRKERTFRRIMDEYDDMISRLCFGYTRNNQEFEDLRQDCYAAIWQSLGRFNEKSQIKTWLYRVVLNTCVSTLRRRKKEPAKTSLADFTDVIDTDSDHLRLLSEMHDLISMLPPIEKAIILMWLDEMSYEEIAPIVGLPRNTVATKLRRTKEKLMNIN